MVGVVENNNNFDFRVILYFLLGFCFGLIFSMNTSVFAYEYGDSDNDFQDVINTMTEFTSLNKVLNDTSFVDSADYIQSQIKSCDNVYLLSYYNSGVDSARSYKSIDLYCLSADIRMTPVVSLDNHSLTSHFYGTPGESFTYRDHSQIFARNRLLTFDDFGHAAVDYSNNPNIVVRSFFNVSNYYDFDQPMPNYFMSKSFSDTNFIFNIFNSANSFGWYIALMVSLFIFLYILNKKLGLGLGFDYKGGVKI